MDQKDDVDQILKLRTSEWPTGPRNNFVPIEAEQSGPILLFTLGIFVLTIVFGIALAWMASHTQRNVTGAFRWMRLEPTATATKIAEPDQQAVVRAGDAVDRFHAGLTQERYEEVCGNVESPALSGVTGLECSEFLAYLRGRLGVVVGARRVQVPTIGGSGAKVIVVLDYETDYEHGTGREHFE